MNEDVGKENTAIRISICICRIFMMAAGEYTRGRMSHV